MRDSTFVTLLPEMQNFFIENSSEIPLHPFLRSFFRPLPVAAACTMASSQVHLSCVSHHGESSANGILTHSHRHSWSVGEGENSGYLLRKHFTLKNKLQGVTILGTVFVAPKTGVITPSLSRPHFRGFVCFVKPQFFCLAVLVPFSSRSGGFAIHR